MDQTTRPHGQQRQDSGHDDVHGYTISTGPVSGGLNTKPLEGQAQGATPERPSLGSAFGSAGQAVIRSLGAVIRPLF